MHYSTLASVHTVNSDAMCHPHVPRRTQRQELLKSIRWVKRSRDWLGNFTTDAQLFLGRVQSATARDLRVQGVAKPLAENRHVVRIVQEHSGSSLC